MARPEPLSFQNHGRLRMKPMPAGTSHFVQVFDSEFTSVATRGLDSANMK